MWDLPRPGLEPVCPALAGRFSTTAPPGKPNSLLMFVYIMFAYIKVFKLFRFTNLGDIFYTLLCSSFSNISRILSHANMNRFPLLHCSIVFHCHNLVNHSPIDRNFIHFIFFYMNYATTNVLAQCKFCLQHKFLEMEILGQNVYIFKC